MDPEHDFQHRTEIGRREASKRGYRSRWVEAGGLKTHYMELGEGDPLLIVHGGGPGAAGFLGYPHFIPAAAEHFRVVAPDLRGFGLTDKPNDEPYSFKRQADHLSAFVDTLCLRDVNIVGNSMGATTLMRYVVDHSERIRRVLAVSSGSLAVTMGVEMAVRPNIKEPEWTRETVRSFLEKITRQHHLITDDLVDTRVELANLPGAPEWADKVATYALEWMDDPHERQLNEMSCRIPKLPIPVRWAWGRDDTFTPPSLADELLKLMPDMDLVLFDGAGHQLQNDVPDQFNSMAMAYFLDP